MNTTTRDQVIADEQKAVDRAYDCYAERLAEMTGTAAATAAASNKDGIANRLDAEEKAAAYDGLGGESLVTARVDAPDEPGSEPRPWYIGRRAVSDVRTRDTVVVLWTSPMATKWAAVQPQTPGDITLRRQLRCVQRVVEDYFDDIAPAVPVPVPAPVPPVLPAVPAPRQAGDDTAVQEPSADEGTAVEGADTTAADRRPPARTPPTSPGDGVVRPSSRTTSCCASSSAPAAAACGTSSRPSAATRWTWSPARLPTSSSCRAGRARESPQSVCTA